MKNLKTETHVNPTEFRSFSAVKLMAALGLCLFGAISSFSLNSDANGDLEIVTGSPGEMCRELFLKSSTDSQENQLRVSADFALDTPREVALQVHEVQEATSSLHGMGSPVRRARQLTASWEKLQTKIKLENVTFRTDKQKIKLKDEVARLKAETIRAIADLRGYEPALMEALEEVHKLNEKYRQKIVNVEAQLGALSSSPSDQRAKMELAQKELTRLSGIVAALSAAEVSMLDTKESSLFYYLSFRNILDFEMSSNKFELFGAKEFWKSPKELQGRGQNALLFADPDSRRGGVNESNNHSYPGHMKNTKSYPVLTKKRIQYLESLTASENLTIFSNQKQKLLNWSYAQHEIGEIEELMESHPEGLIGRSIRLDYLSGDKTKLYEIINFEANGLKIQYERGPRYFNWSDLRKSILIESLAMDIEELIKQDIGFYYFFNLDSSGFYKKANKMEDKARRSVNDLYPAHVVGISKSSGWVSLLIKTSTYSRMEWVPLDSRIIFPDQTYRPEYEESFFAGNQKLVPVGSVVNFEGRVRKLFALDSHLYWVGIDSEIESWKRRERPLGKPSIYSQPLHTKITVPDFIEKTKLQAEPHGHFTQRVEDLGSMTHFLKDYSHHMKLNLDRQVGKNEQTLFERIKNLVVEESLLPGREQYLSEIWSNLQDAKGCVRKNVSMAELITKEILEASEFYLKQDETLIRTFGLDSQRSKSLQAYFKTRQNRLFALLEDLTLLSLGQQKFLKELDQLTDRCENLKTVSLRAKNSKISSKQALADESKPFWMRELLKVWLSSLTHFYEINYRDQIDPLYELSLEELRQRFPSDASIFPLRNRCFEVRRQVMDFFTSRKRVLEITLPDLGDGLGIGGQLKLKKDSGEWSDISVEQVGHQSKIDKVTKYSRAELMYELNHRTLDALIARDMENSLKIHHGIYVRDWGSLVIELDVKTGQFLYANSSGLLGVGSVSNLSEFKSEK